MLCTSTFALFPSGTVFFPNQKSLWFWSLQLPPSLFISLVIPFWIYFRPVKNMSSIQFKLPFPQTPLLKKKRKQQHIKPSFLWDAWGWQSRIEVPVRCQGHVLPIRFAAPAFSLLILSWAASGETLSCPSCHFPSLQPRVADPGWEMWEWEAASNHPVGRWKINSLKH